MRTLHIYKGIYISDAEPSLNKEYLRFYICVQFGEPLKIELEAFLKAVRDNEEPQIAGEDGLKALEVAIKCL